MIPQKYCKVKRMIKCFNSVHLYLTGLTVEVDDGARYLFMHDCASKLPYSEEEGWSRGLRLCLQWRHQKHFFQITAVNVDSLNSIINSRLCMAKSRVSWLGRTPHFSPWFFYVPDMATVSIRGDAYLLQCCTVTKLLLQAASYSSELLSSARFQKIYWDNRYLIQHMAMPVKKRSCCFSDCVLKKASVMDVSFLSCSEMWSLMMTRQYFDGATIRSFHW